MSHIPSAALLGGATLGESILLGHLTKFIEGLDRVINVAQIMSPLHFWPLHSGFPCVNLVLKIMIVACHV